MPLSLNSTELKPTAQNNEQINHLIIKTMPHFKELLDPNFLANIDFINDKAQYDRKTVTITEVKREKTHNGKGGTEDVTTLHFKECKPLILSNRNFKTILQMTKKVNTDDWKGVRIELYILENQKAFGQMWDVVRVATTKLAPEVAVDYTPYHNKLKACTTLEQLQQVYLSFTGDQKNATEQTKNEMKGKLA